MNKITRKQYHIYRNVFVDWYFLYAISCKSIYSVKQHIKRTYKNKKFVKVIKIKKNFSLKRVC